MKWLCKILGHNWELTFPFKDNPLRCEFVCKRCGISQYTMPNPSGR